jgi:hypothetical protein
MTPCSLGVLLLTASLATPAQAGQNSCLAVIEALRDAGDCQVMEAIPLLTWSDGFTQWPGHPRGKWSEINSSGPCPKYKTTLREIRVSPIVGNRQVARLKVILMRVNVDGDFTGSYQVTKQVYTCERRNGQWRLFSQVITQRTDHEDKKVMRRMENKQ